jgi:uncharacterized iron-regulated protein
MRKRSGGRRILSKASAFAFLVLLGPGCSLSSDSDLPPGHPPIPPPAEEADSREAVHVEEEAQAGWSLWSAQGREITVQELAAAVQEVEVVFVGERHGDPGAHHFQDQLLDALVEFGDRGGRTPILSLEMFERDVQGVLDEYLEGWITEEHFLRAARPWPSYRRDYRPLVERAREKGVSVLAANAPRRYVNRVSRLGRSALEDLPDHALEHLAPLPFPGPSDAYRAEWDALMGAMMGDHGVGGHPGGEAHGDGADGPLEAQALWDATMAHSVAGALDAASGRPLVLHLTGGFHVENRTGTPEALLHYRPETSYLVVMVREGDGELSSPPGTELLSGADFVVVTRGRSTASGSSSSGMIPSTNHR